MGGEIKMTVDVMYTTAPATWAPSAYAHSATKKEQLNAEAPPQYETVVEAAPETIEKPSEQEAENNQVVSLVTPNSDSVEFTSDREKHNLSFPKVGFMLKGERNLYPINQSQTLWVLRDISVITT
jgi:methionine-rich copper-binding protein CopC